MVAKINFNAIKDLKPKEAYTYINSLEKYHVKDLLLKDILHENMLDKPVKDFYFIDLSPRGVYMFFEEERIRYIGQTNQSFYQRLPTQLDTYVHPGGFGWNSLLRMMGGARTGKLHDDLTSEDHEVDFDELMHYRLVLIEVDRSDDINANNLIWIEKVLLKTYRAMNGERLLNGRIGWLREDDWERSIGELIR